MARRGLTVALLVLLVLSSSIPISASGNATVEAVRPVGNGVIETDGGGTYLALWRAQTIEAVVSGDGEHEVCLEVGPSEVECQSVRLIGANETITFELSEWPANMTGQQGIAVVVRSGGSSEPEARSEQTVIVLTAAGDHDADGLANRRETSLGTAVTVADSDGDGLSDGDEVNRFASDPLVPDTDGDGLGDGVEVNKHETNPTERDTDTDNLTDSDEVNVHRTDPTTPDSDGDGLEDGAEVNKYDSNPSRADTDGDGLDDGTEINVQGTDVTVADTDGDGLEDGPEVNRYGTNPTKADTDGDGLADGAEVNRYGTNPTKPDTDGDGHSDGREVAAGTDPSQGVWLLPIAWQPYRGLIGLAVLVVVLAAAGAVVVERRTTVRAAIDRGRARLGTVLAAWTTDGDEPDRHTNEGRILRLLEEHDGRLPQSEIVEQTDWSKAKVSRLLSSMEAEDKVRKISVGRGNLIATPGNEPDHAQSPVNER